MVSWRILAHNAALKSAACATLNDTPWEQVGRSSAARSEVGVVGPGATTDDTIVLRPQQTRSEELNIHPHVEAADTRQSGASSASGGEHTAKQQKATQHTTKHQNINDNQKLASVELFPRHVDFQIMRFHNVLRHLQES